MSYIDPQEPQYPPSLYYPPQPQYSPPTPIPPQYQSHRTRNLVILGVLLVLVLAGGGWTWLQHRVSDVTCSGFCTASDLEPDVQDSAQQTMDDDADLAGVQIVSVDCIADGDNRHYICHVEDDQGDKVNMHVTVSADHQSWMSTGTGD